MRGWVWSSDFVRCRCVEAWVVAVLTTMRRMVFDGSFGGRDRRE